MASPSVTDNKPLLLLRLWRNKEYRSVFIQITTILILFTLLGMIGNNVVTNLEKAGKEFSFGFLSYPAGYDITFQPFISFSPTDTHLRAAVVGLLNTLLVAVTGVIIASILGFTMGVLRLSNNWLISRIVYVFLEFTRNIPVLLHIFFVYGIFLYVLPVPKKAVNISDTVFLTNRGFFIPSLVFEDGFGYVLLALLAAVAAVIAFVVWERKNQDETGENYPVFSISAAIIIGLPLLTFFISGSPLSWDIPAIKGFNFKGGTSIKPEYIALTFALAYYTSCFIAEIVRSGILAVSKGQTEASHALGLTHGSTLRLVIIPQALRVIIPPLASQYLNLTKNSSLAIAIGYMDVVATIGGISLMQTGKEMETMIFVLLTYLSISLLISAFMNWFNKRMSLVER
ncbi:MAG: ABC transporter permease subunit [SAR324 cluster bacterium]|jgi:general L-amino acid transport system permease protein|uniref:ABC transmembrane type-1 domain-containing protein n=1 Tax=marine metagenome TaxID=408172 RepID=A0A381Q3S3_9ZZZZ|nr:ABC transporter permease subunit [SAR324 cluster bacterium]MDP7583833.1 ABC transporter permease subunit [SAR324 cluster bacterium]HBR58926.1 amino acid ABC transporter permease [Deltaproteobacteria bacterium]